MTEETKALTKPTTVYIVPISDMRQMAEAVAKSGLFGMKTTDQALALMLIAHAEGLHPAIAARDYDIIQGRPSKKAEAMLRTFLDLGGKVEWHDYTDEKVSATFSSPQASPVRIDWDLARAKKAGLGGKDMYAKYPRQMLRARVISEGVRTIDPRATSGMYTSEEVADFEPKRPQQKRREETPSEPEAATEPEEPQNGSKTWDGEKVAPFKKVGLAGKKWNELPHQTLVWAVENMKPPAQDYAKLEIERRIAVESESQVPLDAETVS